MQSSVTIVQVRQLALCQQTSTDCTTNERTQTQPRTIEGVLIFLKDSLLHSRPVWSTSADMPLNPKLAVTRDNGPQHMHGYCIGAQCETVNNCCGI
jgi:hypothetical protein